MPIKLFNLTLNRWIQKLEEVLKPEIKPLYVVTGTGKDGYFVGPDWYPSLADIEKQFPGYRVIPIQLPIPDAMLAEI